MTGGRSKKLILCADDFGIAPGVNRAILELIDAGRLNATSCMTSMPDWSSGSAKLKSYAGQIQLGLHITLTDQKSCAPMHGLAPDGQLPSNGTLLKMALLRQLNIIEILGELQRQYDAFCEAVETPPDFIDGHHHVHQLPLIRDAVIELINRNKVPTKPWVRICWEQPARLIMRRESTGRALAIGLFGLGLKRRAQLFDIPHNAGFTGVYDYRRKSMDEALMARLLYGAIEGTVMFLHPGFVDAQLASVDELTGHRQVEYEFLRSAEFQNLLNQCGFTLFPEIPPQKTA